MSSQPQPPAPVRRRRRRSSRRYLYVSAIACGLVLLSIPLAHDYYVRARRAQAPAAPAPAPALNSDLVLGEAGVRQENGQTFIAGVLENQSKKRYRDIQIRFRVRGGTGAVLGPVAAEVKLLEPGAKAQFRTTPLPAEAARFGPPDIAGTPE